jgi:hypothetical protein
VDGIRHGKERRYQNEAVTRFRNEISHSRVLGGQSLVLLQSIDLPAANI